MHAILLGWLFRFQEEVGPPRLGWWLFVAALIVGAILWLNARRRP